MAGIMISDAIISTIDDIKTMADGSASDGARAAAFARLALALIPASKLATGTKAALGVIAKGGLAVGRRALPAAKYVAKGFSSAGNLAAHFVKHGDEWGKGNITMEGYAKRAKSLLEKDIGGDILGMTRKRDGAILRYNMT
jgi:hypothetical protein